jgi:hypothetical protein
MESKFTYNYLNEIIHKLRLNDYVICKYSNSKQYDKVCIFRHDVDYDITKALEMARFEYNCKIQSTYFFLISSDFYNILSKKNLDIIKLIHSFGHDIGLHFDETKYDIKNKDEFIFFVKKELSIMNKATGLDVKSVSMHRPSKFFLNSNLKIPNVINSYSSEFFNEFKYISDSRMKWGDDILMLIESNIHKKIHLLTHPFWYSAKAENTKDKIINFINSGNMSRFRLFDENFTNISEFVKEDEIL